MPLLQHHRWIALATALLLPVVALSAPCTAVSGTHRVALLELYTSEGCDSCPPTDRWVSALPARGFTSARILALAFHVDYWNHLGWNDPYAQARFSERQRLASARNQARFVYTPQLMLNGRDYRRGVIRDDFVVRELAGPFAADASGALDIAYSFRLDRNWKPGDLHVAAFVQNQQSGDVLQALVAARCN